MAVYLAWIDDDVPLDLPGPWHELRTAAPGVLLVDSDDSQSTVFHELKWSLADDTPLLVVSVTAVPKLRGLAPGTLSWLRARLDRTDERTSREDPRRRA